MLHIVPSDESLQSGDMATGLGTERSRRTCLAIARGERGVDDLVVRLSIAGAQLRLLCPCCPRGLLLFPIDKKVTGIEASLLRGLPMIIFSGRPTRSICSLVGSQQGVWRPHSLYPQYVQLQEPLYVQISMNGRSHCIIRDRSRCGSTCVIINGDVLHRFSQMHFVANQVVLLFLL